VFGYRSRDACWRGTGASRPYGTNPYTGLDDPNGQPFLFRGDVDVRAKAMQRVVAIEAETAAAAWSLDGLGGGDRRRDR